MIVEVLTKKFPYFMENNFSPIQFYVHSTEKLFHEFNDFLIFAVFAERNCNVSTDCVKVNTYALSSFFPAINLTESYFTKNIVDQKRVGK